MYIIDPDSCFTHFHVEMFLSASCVVYWSAVRDSGEAKMKTSWNYFPFLLKDLNTTRAVWSSFLSGYCSSDWQNSCDNEKLIQRGFPAVLYSGKAGSALHTAKLTHEAWEAAGCTPNSAGGKLIMKIKPCMFCYKLLGCCPCHLTFEVAPKLGPWAIIRSWELEPKIDIFGYFGGINGLTPSQNHFSILPS